MFSLKFFTVAAIFTIGCFASATDLSACYQQVFDNDVLETFNNDCFEGTTELQAEISFDGLIGYGKKECSTDSIQSFYDYAAKVIEKKKACVESDTIGN